MSSNVLFPGALPLASAGVGGYTSNIPLYHISKLSIPKSQTLPTGDLCDVAVAKAVADPGLGRDALLASRAEVPNVGRWGGTFTMETWQI